MIRTFEELVEFSQENARTLLEGPFPDMADDFRMEMGGLPERELELIKEALPGLPDSYLNCCREVDFLGAHMHSVVLQPGFGKNGGTLREQLTCMNWEGIGFGNELKKRSLYVVASCDPSSICVAGKSGPFEEGQVVDFWPAGETPFRVLARDFREFLLMLGNSYQVSQDDEIEDRDAEFRARMSRLNIPEELTSEWLPVGTF